MSRLCAHILLNFFISNEKNINKADPLECSLYAALNLNERQFSLVGHHYGSSPHSRARFIYLSLPAATFSWSRCVTLR